METHKQLEEIQSLEAIYGPDFHYFNETSFSITVNVCTSSEEEDHNCTLELQFMLPVNYPSELPPVFCMRCLQFQDEDIKELAKQFNESFIVGDVVIYQWVELAREYLNNKKERRPTIDDTYTEHHSPTAHLQSLEEIKLERTNKSEVATVAPVSFHGESLTDRKSTFQAHLAEVHSIDEVHGVMSELKGNRKISLATHNIVAYRFIDMSKGGGVQVQDCDDDGESAAGGRLLHLLQIMDVQNTLVMVSRWYGGIQLGPDRFKHINNVARSLLLATGRVGASGGGKLKTSGGGSKSKGGKKLRT